MEIYKRLKIIASQINKEIIKAGLTCVDEPLQSRYQLIPNKLVKECPKYIQRVIREINSTYESGCFISCGILIRRLIETMMIEAFEKNNLAHLIKKEKEYKSADDIKNELLRDPFNNISRNARKALNNKKILELGNQCAHDRFFIAQKSDIDNIILDVRILIEYLVWQILK